MNPFESALLRQRRKQELEQQSKNQLILDKNEIWELREKLLKLQNKVKQLREERNELMDKNDQLRETVLRFQEEDLYGKGGENDWMKDLKTFPTKKFDDINNSPNNKHNLGDTQKVQSLLQGYSAEMRKMEERMVHVNVEQELQVTKAEQEKYEMEGSSIFTWIRETKTSISDFIDRNYPMRSDIRWAQVNYGTGIASFFAFYRFVVLNSVLLSLIWLTLVIQHTWRVYRNPMNGVTLWSLSKSGFLPRAMMFSSFHERDSTLYANSVLATILIVTFVSLLSWKGQNWKVTQARELDAEQGASKGTNKRFADLSLNFWSFDGSMVTEQEVYEGKVSVIQQLRLRLKDEMLHTLFRSRSKKEKYLLYCRRGVGILINLAFVVGSWYAIFLLVRFRKSIIAFSMAQLGLGNNAVFIGSAIPASLLTLVGLILPTVTGLMTDLEKWDDELVTLKHQIGRLFFGRIMNLVVVGVQFYSLKNRGRSIVAIFGQSVSSLRGEFDPASADYVANETSDHAANDSYVCMEDKAAEQLFVIVLADFIVPKIMAPTTFYVKEFLKRLGLRSVYLAHAPYSVSETTIDILYSQGLCWVTLPFFPFMAILSPIMALISFKFQKRVISKYRSKPTSTLWKESDTGSFFIFFYNLTLVLALISYSYFLLSSLPCYTGFQSSDDDDNDSSSVLTPTEDIAREGAFSNTRRFTPLLASVEYLKKEGLSIIWTILKHPLPYFLLAVYQTMTKSFVENVVMAKDTILQSKRKQIEELQRKLASQKRRLEMKLKTSPLF